ARERCGGLERHAVGHRVHLRHRSVDAFRQPTPVRHGHDALPGNRPGDIVGNLLDDPGDLAARHERQVRLLLVQAAYEQEVGEVDADGRAAAAYLSRLQVRRLYVVQHGRFGRAELAADDGFHGAPPSTNMPSHSAMTAGFASPLISTTISV